MLLTKSKSLRDRLQMAKINLQAAEEVVEEFEGTQLGASTIVIIGQDEAAHC